MRAGVGGAGAKVALCARNQEKLEQLAGEINGKGGEAAAFKIDVGSEEEIKAGVKAAIARFGKIDILVNNAGITRDQLVMRMKRADWDDVINTNLTGPFLLIQAVIGSMLKQRWGRIINITSIFGQIGQVGQANYSSSKAGLIGLTMAVAREVGSRNITVNAVAPGFIETAMTAVLSAELKETMLKNIPLGRAGSDGCGARRQVSGIGGSGIHHRRSAEGQRRNPDGMKDCERDRGSNGEEQLEHVRNLFREYQAELPSVRSRSRPSFQLPGEYAPPKGKLLLATVAGQPVGCVGLRPFPQQGACEMKHLYVRPTFRGRKLAGPRGARG